MICTLGDLLLDVVVRLEEPLASGSDTRATTRAGAGGQAANVAAWAAALGASARFVGKRGRDAAGELVARELGARGVEVVGPAVEGRNGVVVSVAEPDGERTMLSDRGVAPDLRPDELEPAWFAAADWLHLAGYSLVRSPIDAAAARAAELARAAGAQLSVDLSAWTVVREFGAGRLRARLAELRPDVVFATEREREELGPFDVPTWVVKRGARGCVVEREGERAELAARSADVVDTTGAGDALAAGFLVGGAELGVEAAARCVAQLGAMP